MEAANENTIILTGKDLLYWYMRSKLIKTLLDNQEKKENIEFIQVYPLKLILKREADSFIVGSSLVDKHGTETFTEHQIKMLKYVLFGHKLPSELEDGLLDILKFLLYGDYSRKKERIAYPPPNKSNKNARNQWEQNAANREAKNTQNILEMYDYEVIRGNIMYNQFMRNVNKLSNEYERSLLKRWAETEIAMTRFDWVKLNKLDDTNKNLKNRTEVHDIFANFIGTYYPDHDIQDELEREKKSGSKPYYKLSPDGMSYYHIGDKFDFNANKRRDEQRNERNKSNNNNTNNNNSNSNNSNSNNSNNNNTGGGRTRKNRK